MYENDGPSQIHGAIEHLNKEMGSFMENAGFRHGLWTTASGTICLKITSISILAKLRKCEIDTSWNLI